MCICAGAEEGVACFGAVHGGRQVRAAPTAAERGGGQPKFGAALSHPGGCSHPEPQRYI